MPSHKRVQRATQWVSARYGTERAVLASRCLAAGHQLSGHPFGCPPLTYPPTPTGGGPTPPGARGPLFIFRKIILYGETKKSTHGHTTRTPTRTGPRGLRRGRPTAHRRAQLPQLPAG